MVVSDGSRSYNVPAAAFAGGAFDVDVMSNPAYTGIMTVAAAISAFGSSGVYKDRPDLNL